MKSIVEKIFYHSGLKCVVVLTPSGHRCGYVGVEPGHPLFGLDYSQNIESKELKQELHNSKIGKKGLLDIFCWDGETTRLSLLIDVHGGITYSALSEKTSYPSNQLDPIWYFGFDCAHLGDAKDYNALAKVYPKQAEYYRNMDLEYRCFNGDTVRTTWYVEQECKNMAEQLTCIADTLTQLEKEK